MMKKIRYVSVLTGSVAFAFLWIHLLLKLSWSCCFLAGLPFVFLLHRHVRRQEEIRTEWRRLEELFLYMDLILHAFAKEQKVNRALAEAAFSLPEGELKERVLAAESCLPAMDRAFSTLETAYPNKRLHTIHTFMRKVEYYGGDVHLPIQILLQDKLRWEKRIREDRKQRQSMFVQVALSCLASLLICSIVMYMPVQGMDISGNMMVQLLTVVVLFLDDFILYRAQSYLRIEWRSVAEGNEDARALTEYRECNSRKEIRLSLLFAAAPFAMLFVAWYLQNLWLFAGMAALLILCLNQHKVGRALAGKRIRARISAEFPKWMLELALLLQSENVHTAIDKSIAQAPPILQGELQLLAVRLEQDPEGASAYHRFFEDFDLPEIRSCMCSLYGIANGSGADGAKQLQDLVEVDLELLDQAEQLQLRERLGGMYMLFLLPVVTASVKLVIDMSIFLLGFLAKGVL